MKSTIAPDDEFVTLIEIARRMGVSPARVAQLEKREPTVFVQPLPPPITKIGRQRVWHWSDIRDWARADGRLR